MSTIVFYEPGSTSNNELIEWDIIEGTSTLTKDACPEEIWEETYRN